MRHETSCTLNANERTVAIAHGVGYRERPQLTYRDRIFVRVRELTHGSSGIEEALRILEVAKGHGAGAHEAAVAT